MTLQMAYDEKYHEGLVNGIQQGRENGIVEEKEDTERRMLSTGKYSNTEISEITGLPMEQIQTLKKSL